MGPAEPLCIPDVAADKMLLEFAWKWSRCILLRVTEFPRSGKIKRFLKCGRIFLDIVQKKLNLNYGNLKLSDCSFNN